MRLRILTHNSGEFETDVEEFDPVSLNEELNSPEINTVVIGNVILSRIDVKNVSVLEELIEE
ncbi:hypothetical protein D1B31_16325 [Neobacillus notoginsengisoli]|uniref:Uncharacterized protein n=1 Tax=Neobacillus notoginsengisoli TaxID=1578198 RepID=A0A417YRJ0_9BACI|nr:hypothetical protein [Neobacillus notoginsengisoli]RHW37329.1 hypothetical protein D1B31_16325 [Neobacillus notoginsengisoli]